MKTCKPKCDFPRFIPALAVKRKVNGSIEQETVPLHESEDVRGRIKEFEGQGAHITMVFLPALDDR